MTLQRQITLLVGGIVLAALLLFSGLCYRALSDLQTALPEPGAAEMLVALLSQLTVLVIVTVPLVMLTVSLATRALTRQIRQLTRSAAQIKLGHFSYRGQSQGPREIRLLNETFNEMANSLVTLNLKLEKTNQELSQAIRASQDELATTRAYGQQIQVMFDSSPDGILMVDQQGVIKMLNERAASMVGYRIDELQDADVALLLPERSRGGHGHMMQGYLQEPTTRQMGQLRNTEIRCKDGHVYPVDISLSPLRQFGQLYVLATVRDVSEQRRTEQAMRESEHRLNLAMSAANDGLWDWDLVTEQVYYSPRWFSMLGYQPDAFPGSLNTFERLVHPDDLMATMELVGQCLSDPTQPAFEKEFRMRCEDGSYRWILSRGSVTEWGGDGQPLRMVGTHVDITKRKEVEQALIESERKISTLIQNLPGIVFRCKKDENWTMEYLSPGFDALTGYVRRDCINNRKLAYADLIHPDDRQRLRQTVEKALAVQQSYTLEYRILRKDGAERWLWERGSGVFDRSNRLLALEGFAIDNTETRLAADVQRRMNEELEERVKLRTVELRQANTALRLATREAREANRAKSDFLANMSHEIRTPMNAIIGLTQLAMNLTLDPQLKDYLQKAFGASGALMEIINDILDFSKIEAGQLSLESIPFALAEVLRNLDNVVALSVQQKGLAFNISIADDVPTDLIGDPLRLGQILINLVNNAIKFTEQGGINVSVKRLPQDQEQQLLLQFEVRDSGIGIRAEQRQGLFTPFTQADTSTTREYGGTGLGLSICQRLVAMMEGEIWVQSEAGKGSRFLFTARFSESAIPVVSTEEVQLDLQQLHDLLDGCHLLLAEDNPVNQQVAVEMLKLVGAKVDVVSNGREAVEWAQRGDYDLILMDVQMPEMDGYRATRKLRSQENCKDLPIIAMTANAMSGDRDKCLLAGMNDHLTKPVIQQDLYETLARWLDRQGKLQRAQALVSAGDKPPAALDRTLPIDFEFGLNQFPGKPVLYWKSLQQFSQQYLSSVTRLRQLIDQEQFVEAERLMHTVKGVAANLGCWQLQRAAASIERSLAEGDEAFERQLETYQQAWQQFQQTSATRQEWLQVDVADAGKLAPAEGGDTDDALLLQLRQLDQQLQHSDFIDEQQISRLTRELGPLVSSTAYREMLDAIDNFDNESAARHLQGLLQLVDTE